MKGKKDPRQLSIDELIDVIQHSADGLYAGKCLIEMRNRFLPLIKSLTYRYFIRGMEFEDWLQEAVFVMIKTIRLYQFDHQTKFSSFYRRCLKNWFNDLVRSRNAKKRIPGDRLTSYDSNPEYYDDMVVDDQIIDPEQVILTTDFLKKLLYCCSRFEKAVALGVIIHHQSPAVIASQNHCSVSSVKSAFARCATKYRNLQGRELN